MTVPTPDLENLLRLSMSDKGGASLAPGASCTLSVVFQPRIVGFDAGTITVTYRVGQTQIIHLRAIGQ